MREPQRSPTGTALTDLILDLFRLNNRMINAGDKLVEGLGLTSARWHERFCAGSRVPGSVCRIGEYCRPALRSAVRKRFFCSRKHGPELLGAMFAAFTGASIAGAAIAAAIGERMPRLMVYTVAFLLTGFPRFLVLALDAPLPIIFLTLAIAGFASGFLNPILSAVIFERIPKPLIGRVTAMNAALCFALIPFGGLFGGALISMA